MVPFVSKLNRELYNVMKKVENQHSGKAFIVKGLNRWGVYVASSVTTTFISVFFCLNILFSPVFFCSSTTGKSKKRKSLVISNPIPCNTAFPADHVSIHSTTENAKDDSSAPVKKTQSISEETGAPEEGSISSKDVNSSDSDLSSCSSNTPKRQSVCDNESSDGGSGSHSPEEAEAEAEAAAAEAAEGEQATNQSDDSGVEALKSEAASQEVSNPSDSADSEAAQSPEPENVSNPPSEEAKPKPAPVPAPRISFRSTDRGPLLKAASVEKEETNQEAESESGDDSSTHSPPGFLYKVHSPVAPSQSKMLVTIVCGFLRVYHFQTDWVETKVIKLQEKLDIISTLSICQLSHTPAGQPKSVLIEV